MKKLNLIISIFILFNTSYFLNAQKVEKVKLKIPSRPWHVSYVSENSNLKYYFHSVGDIKEDVTTDIYNIDVSGKIIKKDTEELSYKDTKEKYPWYFYEGKRIVKEEYRMIYLFNAFVFEKYNWKQLFHLNQLNYEHILKVSGNEMERIKYKGELLKGKYNIKIKDYTYLLKSEDYGDFIFIGNKDLTYKIKKLDYGKIENHKVEYFLNAEGKISGIIINANFKEESEEYKKGKKKIIVHLDKDFNVDKKYLFDDIYLNTQTDTENSEFFVKVVENGVHKSYLFDKHLNVIEEKELKVFPLFGSGELLLDHKGITSYLYGKSITIIDRENNIIEEKKLAIKDDYYIEDCKYSKLPDGYYYCVAILENKNNKKKGFVYIKAKYDKIINTKIFYEDLDNVISYQGKMPSEKKINKTGFSSSGVLQSKDGGIFNSLQYGSYTFLQVYDKAGNLQDTYYREIDDVFTTFSGSNSNIYVHHTSYSNATKNIIEGEKNIYWINGTHKIAITVIDKTSKKITNEIQIKEDIFSWAVNISDGYINIPTLKGKIIKIKFE